jgi:hypothetical protein
MKIRILLFLFVLAFNYVSIGQISVSSNTLGRVDEFKPEVFKNFKGTTTIFILSNIYDKAEYDKLLKSCWTVTPYKIVSANDFDYKDFLTKEYSFAHLICSVYEKDRSFFSRNNIKIHLLDIDKINSKLEDTKGKYEKFLSLVNKNFIEIASFDLFANTEFLNRCNKSFGNSGGFQLVMSNIEQRIYIYTKKMFPEENEMKNLDFRNDLKELVYEKKSFKNYNLGTLKNYFQKVNELLSKEQFYWMYEADKLPEIKNLKTATLYIPDYNKIKYRPVKMADEDKSEKDLTELFEDYPYKYEFISDKNLENKILNNEEIYYLRYVKVNSQKFFHIVNSKSGEVIYRDYDSGMSSYNIDNKDFKNLAKAIEK